MLQILGYIFYLFVLIAGFIGILLLSTKETDVKHVPTKTIEPNDTWEKRYFSLVQKIWYLSDAELEDYTYEKDHEDVMEEIQEMNEAVCEKRTIDDA